MIVQISHQFAVPHIALWMQFQQDKILNFIFGSRNSGLNIKELFRLFNLLTLPERPWLHSLPAHILGLPASMIEDFHEFANHIYLCMALV